jgi:hypothetical protein
VLGIHGRLSSLYRLHEQLGVDCSSMEIAVTPVPRAGGERWYGSGRRRPNMTKQSKDESSTEAPKPPSSGHEQELSDAELDTISGGADGMNALITVSNLKTQTASSSLTDFADRQPAIVYPSTKKRT